jgi:hypothetical protein
MMMCSKYTVYNPSKALAMFTLLAVMVVFVVWRIVTSVNEVAEEPCKDSIRMVNDQGAAWCPSGSMQNVLFFPNGNVYVVCSCNDSRSFRKMPTPPAPPAEPDIPTIEI